MAALKVDFDKNYKRMERVQTGVSQNGLPLYSVVDRTKPEDYERYNNQMRALASEYQDVILYNEALVRKSDQWLQELIQIVQMADNAARSMRRVNTAAQTATGVLGMSEPPSGISAPRSLGTLPGPMGINVSEQTANIPDKLPALENMDNLLGNITIHSGTAADGLERMNTAAEGFSSMGRAAENLGNAFQNMGGSGMRSAGSIISAAGAAVQAYTQMAQAASMAAAAEAATETPTVWGKIAAITAILGAFTAMVSQIQSSVRTYADGGIIPGQNYNDGITARVSSGEMIINQADQKRLYDSIHTGGVSNGTTRSTISGEQIVIAVNNYARRTNRGELVFAGRG